jgi:hypothetical protein
MKKILAISVLLIIAVSLVGAGNASDEFTRRPIEDFVDRQGTWCVTNTDTWPFDGYYNPIGEPCTEEDGILFVPPVANFLGWTDPANGLALSADYAGLADGVLRAGDEEDDGDDDTLNFDTKFRGRIIERPLEDGSFEVHVWLRTTNALTWVVELSEECNWSFADCLVKFGTRWEADGALDGEPALGKSFIHLVLNTPEPDYPLPDMIQMFYGPDEDESEFVSIVVRAKAFGRLDNGSPGWAKTVQKATAEEWPVETVTVRALDGDADDDDDDDDDDD